MRTTIAATSIVFLCNACGGAARTSDMATGHVDFSYELDGKAHRLSELRRRPTFLVLMRTSEIVSQIYMNNVVEIFNKRAGELQVLVLSVEPSEKPFVRQYAEFEKLPFSVGVAAEDVLFGRSPLGAIPGIPSTYLVDADGSVVFSAPGVLPVKEVISRIDALLDI